jgi:hypothetical protein
MSYRMSDAAPAAALLILFGFFALLVAFVVALAVYGVLATSATLVCMAVAAALGGKIVRHSGMMRRFHSGQERDQFGTRRIVAREEIKPMAGT